MKTDPNGRWQCDIFPDKPRQFSVKLKHPDYADMRIWVNEREYKFDDFYQQKSVVKMEKGVLLEGWVTNSDGLPIKDASVFTGEDRFDNDSPKTTTDSQGRFQFSHFLPRLNNRIVLTVRARGYAPELKLIPMSSYIEPVTITLGLPHTIRGRVVDINGNPIAGAGVDVDDWRDFRSLSWNSKTDADGRFIWTEAPADAVDIDIYKDKYMRVDGKGYVACDEEYEIVMYSPLVVSGVVVDAETNEPIQDFTATQGIQWASIHWQTDRIFKKDFSGGQYEVSFDQPYPGHLIRIDAEGYLPAKSRVFTSDEGAVSYDFQLEKGTGSSGIVYLPDGSPAEGAEIYVVMPNKYLSFENGIPTNKPDENEWAVTDENGTFSLKPLLNDTPYELVVIHDKGFTEVSKQQWLEDPNILLQKWGRVEGTLYLGLRPEVNQGVHFYDRNTHNDPQEMNYYYGVNVVTDSQGHFKMERVIPGQGAIARRLVRNNGRTSSYSGTQDIDVVAGQTTYVDIGGGGRFVTGTIIKPEWATGTTDMQNTNPRISPAQTQNTNPYEIYADMGLEFPMPERFDDMTVAEVMQWFMEWAKSEKGQAFQKEIEKKMKERGINDGLHYNVMIDDDGSFQILDVLPGTYILSTELYKANKEGYADINQPVVAEIKHTFTVDGVTEANQDIPVELGLLEFMPAATLELNEPIPDFSVRSLDGGMLNLADFRNQYLLLTFYMAVGQENLDEDMANLRQIQKDFAGDERFEMVGITQGGLPILEKLTTKFLIEQRLTWRQGFIDGTNYELLQTYKIQSWPHSLLVGPDGVLLANGLKGKELYEAVVKALAK